MPNPTGIPLTDQNAIEEARRRERLIRDYNSLLPLVRGRSDARYMGGPFASGVSNAREYSEGLRQDSDLARIEAELQGQEPPRVVASYGGTEWGGGGGMGDRAARSFAAARPQAGSADEDRFDREDRLRANKAAVDSAEAASRAAVFATDPYRARQAGEAAVAAQEPIADFQREEERRQAAEFFQPDIQARREAQRQIQKELYGARYVAPAEVRGQYQLGSAQVQAAGRVGAAGATSRGGLSREAMRGMIEGMKLRGMVPDDQIQRYEDYFDQFVSEQPTTGEPETVEGLVADAQRQLPDASPDQLLEAIKNATFIDPATGQERPLTEAELWLVQDRIYAPIAPGGRTPATVAPLVR